MPTRAEVSADIAAKITDKTAAGSISNVDDGANRELILDYVDGKTPTKEYSIVLSQIGTAAPTAQVFRNTLGGTVVWARASAGSYTGTLAGAFAGNVKVTPMRMYSKLDGKGWYAYISDADTISIVCRNDAGAFADLNMSDASDLTITVYP